MCSTTPKTKAASPAVVAPYQIGDKTKAINSLQKYLEKVYPAVRSECGPDLNQKTHIPISIYLKSKESNHIYAGIYDDEHHYSASLLKVAAMFAAFKLRKEAKILAKKIKDGSVVANNPTQFFSKLDAQFNPNDAVPGIATKAGINKRPKYSDILLVTGFPKPDENTVKFQAGFEKHMLRMIVPSDNCDAGECIVSLGYPYINVKLLEDGFFEGPTWNTSTPKGIWLAGDYIISSCFNAAKKQSYVRVTTINDCDGTNFCGSAQNTSSKQMARMFFEILTEKLIDKDSSNEMHEYLHKAQFGTTGFMPAPDPSFVSRVTDVPLLFDVEAVKIGQGPIKLGSDRGNIDVRSEGIIIKWQNLADPDERKKWDALNLTGEGAICWQNVSNMDNAFLTGIAKIINQTISKFINQEPI